MRILFRTVDGFLSTRPDITPSHPGRLALNDARFVHEFRRSRRPRIDTAEERWIEAFDGVPSRDPDTSIGMTP